MKKYILAAFTILIFAPANLPAQTNLVISNFDASVDTSWVSTVIPKLNANYGNIVGRLNALAATNSIEDWAISDIYSQVGTNIIFLLGARTNGSYANGRNFTNLWGTNIAAGTLPTNAFSASTLSFLYSLGRPAFTNIDFIPDCLVSFGEGAGGEANFTMGSSADQDDGRVYFSSLSNFQITDPGGFWTGDGTGSGDTDFYTAPVAGWYLLISWIRVTDGTSADSDGIGGAKPGELAIGSHDYPGFQWFAPNGTRCSWQNIRILHLGAGDHVSCVTGSDNGDTASDGNFTVHLLSVP
jgi:hypothetical protein